MADKLAALTKLWDSYGYIPFNLHTAASLGCANKVNELIQEVKNPTVLNEQNKDGWTALMFAAYLGCTEVVALLLKSGAETNIVNFQKETAVMFAAKCGNLSAASLIIDHGADIDTSDSKGWTALFHAVSANHRSLAKLLLEKGCRTNILDSKGYTPLIIAAEAGHEMIVKDLLEKGACPMLSGDVKQSAGNIAIEKGYTKVQKLIDEHLESNSSGMSSIVSLCTILETLDLSKYYPVFERNGIDFNTFRNLTNEDLKELGIGLLGPRKKILAYVLKHQEHKSQTVVKEQQEKEEILKKYEQAKLELAEVKKRFADERKYRSDSERRLAETLFASKCLTEKTRKNAAQEIALLQVLRKALDKHQSILQSFDADIKFSTSSWNQTYTSFQSIEGIFNQICMNTRDLVS